MSNPSPQPDFLAALSDVAGDLGDLFQKELRLAKAEMMAKLSLTLQGGAWMAAAGACGVLIVLLVVAAAVFAIAAQGVAPHWACLIVAGCFLVVAAILYAMAQRALATTLVPTRTLQQVTQDIRVAKEQLS